LKDGTYNFSYHSEKKVRQKEKAKEAKKWKESAEMFAKNRIQQSFDKITW
jgi:hypothetical protein